MVEANYRTVNNDDHYKNNAEKHFTLTKMVWTPLASYVHKQSKNLP
jgi:hypothetical protein